MNELQKNKIFWILLIITIVNVGALAFGKIVIDKAADRVIQKLQKDYSPSPYGPGFDPDKISSAGYSLGQSTVMMGLMSEPNKVLNSDLVAPQIVQNQNNIIELVREADSWRKEWEKDRGFSPAQ